MPPVPPPQAGQPSRPHPQAPFHPTSDQATYRDLLLFEERLKMNAEMLRKRRRRYNAFLWIFISLLIVMAYRLMLTPPRNPFLLRALQASLTVVFMTLALFFASGMYEEKIRYAHSYITHSNKALRPLNMYLNMRLPRFSLLSHIPWYNPSPPAPSAPVPAPTKTTTSKLGTRRQSTNTVMATIPTSSNPRGELIFSSRVDKPFREGYERYRAAFERRREEKQRGERGRGWKRIFIWGRMESPHSIGSAVPTPPASRRGTPPPGAGFGSVSRGGRAPSPGMQKGSGLRSDGKLDLASVLDEKPEKPPLGERGRSDSYSFVLAGPGSKEPALRPNR